jgi:hypothetical protein
MVTLAQANANRKKLKREITRDLQLKDRARLVNLKNEIARARAQKKLLRAEAVGHCRSARSALKERQRAERVSLRDEQKQAKQAARDVCHRGKSEAKLAGEGVVRLAHDALRGERHDQRLIARADKPARLRSTSHERRQEDDDRVRSNLPAELLPVFERVKRRIKGSARRTRTEEFLEWAQENPDEVLQQQQKEADNYLKELLKAEKVQKGNVRKAGRYKGTEEQLRQRLADVPF